jgi:hypothetical protein
LRILKRLEFHDTPKHGSWLNMAELEFSVLGRQCLDRRLPDHDSLARGCGLAKAAQSRACDRLSGASRSPMHETECTDSIQHDPWGEGLNRV